MAKVYAVKVGVTPGIYQTWDECQANVKGYPNAQYKSFTDMTEATKYLGSQEEAESTVAKSATPVDDSLRQKGYEALQFLQDNGLIPEALAEKVKANIDVACDKKAVTAAKSVTVAENSDPSHVTVYVDGSFNSDTNDYGYGVYMDDGTNQRILYGSGPTVDGGRNVEGEVAAATRALEVIAADPKYKSCTIYHDYQGIGSWADHDWKTNKDYTKDYAAFVDTVRREGLQIDFKHVDGHTGVTGNEVVDKLAKIGCGVELTPKERKEIDAYKNVPGFPKGYNLQGLDRVTGLSNETYFGIE